MTGILSDQSLARLRWFASLILVALFAYYIADTLRWPMIWDTPVMHYVHFMMTRGMRPYSDITDMNLPGCYVLEGWAMSFFGWSDLSWRIYEFFLLGCLTVSGMVIGGSRRWFAGIYAAAFFLAMHGAEGPFFDVERDEVMLVLLIAATAFFFLAIRRQKPLFMLPFGLLAGLAMSLKPGSLMLDAALLVLIAMVMHRRGQPIGAYLLWGLAGNLAVALLMLQFLLKNHALQGFLFIIQTVWPAYGRTNHSASAHLLRHLMPVALMPLLALGIVAALLLRDKLGWERITLFLAIATGAFSYFAQGKGTPYHRYMFVVFIALWIGWELTEAMKRNNVRTRAIGAIGTIALFLLVVPYYVFLMHRDAPDGQRPAQLAFSLKQDLTQLGGDDLQQQVQCLDLVNGCLNAMYRLRLVPNTGATGDLLLFVPTESPDVAYYRNWFQTRQDAHPANVVVLGNEWYQNPTPSFDKINAWPQYAAYLHAMYVPVIERHFGTADQPAYRIYLRKGSAVLEKEQANPLR